MTKIIKKNIKGKYKLPSKVKFCKRCVVSNQRPRIVFDDEGVCSACRFAEHKKNIINWPKRESELVKLCNKHRSKDGSYDVIVPISVYICGDQVTINGCMLYFSLSIWAT